MYESLMEGIARYADWKDSPRLDSRETSLIAEKYPGISEEYLTFLKEVGWGGIGIYVYEEPIQPYEVYPEDIKELEGIILFGDDCQGYCFGFDVKNNYELIEVEPPGQIRVLNRSFKEHMFKWLGDPIEEAPRRVVLSFHELGHIPQFTSGSSFICTTARVCSRY